MINLARRSLRTPTTVTRGGSVHRARLAAAEFGEETLNIP